MNRSSIWNRLTVAAILVACASSPVMAVPPPDETPPTDPPSFVATAVSASQINLSWGASTDNKAVTGYYLQRCQPGSCQPRVLLAISPRTYSSTGLSTAVTYTYYLIATDAAGNESNSVDATATTWDNAAPSTPSNLSATTASGSQINLSWIGSTDNVGVSGYSIEYCAGAGCSPATALTTTTSTSYNVQSLSQATPYSFRVRAYDAFPNYSGYTGIASATTADITAPTAPATLNASAASGTQIDLSWAASSDNVGVTAYDIEYCVGSGCSNFSALPSTSSTSYSVGSLTPATSYTFRVRARDAVPLYSGYSPNASATTPDSIAPTTPTAFTASAASSSQINLSWTASTDNVGVAAYHIERCAGAACTNFVEIANTASTTYSNTGLTDATTYRYQVRARDAIPNYSGYSGIAVAATPDGTIPSTPTGLGATVISSTQANLAWTASTDNVGVTGYAVDRCTGAGCTTFAQIATPSTNSYSDTTLSSGFTYRYQVRARDAVPNWSNPSAPASATTTDNQAPSVPTALAATPASATQINLTWTASTDNVAVVAYSVERCTGSTCTTFAEVGTPGGNSFNNTGLTPGTTYRYRVRARDAVPLYSTFSSTVNAATSLDSQAPTVPTGVSATAFSAAQINLSWTASTDNVAVVGYVVERCTGSTCTTFAQIATPTTTSYNDTGRAPNTTYRYQIKARDAAPNTSAASSIVSAATPADTTAPGIPTGLTATPASPIQINLSWTAPTDNVAVTGYEVQRCQGASCTTFASIATPTGTAYNDTGRTPNTTYRYQVRARDAVPNWSAYSSIATGATPVDTAPPSAPANLRTTAVTGTQVNLAWDASTDNVGVIGYLLERCQGSGCTTFAQIAAPTGLTYNDTGRTQYTAYRYRVRATDAATLNSGYSSVLAVTTPDTQAPTTPGSLQVVVSQGQIAVSWIASTDNVGVTAYQVERCSGVSCTTYTQVASTGATTYVDTNLASFTNYSYRVRAVDAAGNPSGYSTVGATQSVDCD